MIVRKMNLKAKKEDMERIFHPRRLAIVGVSTDGGARGFGIGMLVGLQAMGFEGEVFPVNPKGGSYAGLNFYKKVEDIPGQIDFAIIAVAAKDVPEALEACRKKGAAGAEILSAGFSELATKEGRELEHKISEIADRGIRVVGPNCFGIYCPGSGLTLLPGPDLSRISGPVAFLSQSGGMAIDLAHKGKWMGLNFSKVVSFGNGADLREVQLLDYLTEDDETGVIGMYMEGIKDGEAFFNAIKKATKKKPVVVCKGGLSAAGQRMVVSHTASMGGSRVIWESVLRQVNAIQVQNLQELAEACLAFCFLPPKVFRRLSVIGGGGALGVTACDAAEKFGMEIPALEPVVRKNVEELLPKPGSSGANPIDVANPFVEPKILQKVLHAAAQDERVELQIIVSLLYHYKTMARMLGKPIAQVAPYRELAELLGGVVRETGKPIVAVLANPKRGVDDLDIVEMLALARAEFIKNGLPVFDDLHEAIRAIGHVNTYYEKRIKNES
ncbi:MAG TPA: CoA-binding protein [Smithellaceae bacterium]|nr:CoA-binding protein [Smithellaceae bacterium]HRV26070.1 CoA-binding protein [Smithellaceae bacterium]